MERAPRPSPRRRELSPPMVFGIAGAVLTLLAVALWVPVIVHAQPVPIPDPPVYAVLIVFAVFVVGELFPLRFESRREVAFISLSEMPLVIGILLFPAWLVGLLYVVSGLAVFVFRRGSWRSVLMNVALIAVESSIAVAVVALFAQDIRVGDILTITQPRYLPVAAGVLAGALASALAVGIAHGLTGRVESLARLVTRSMMTAAVIIGISLVGFTVWTAIPSGPILCVALAVVCLVLYQNYFSFLQRHADLADLYAFGSSVTQAERDIAGWQELVQQVCEHMGARVAALYLTELPMGVRVLAATPDGECEVPVPPHDDPLLRAAQREGSLIVSRSGTADSALQDALARRGASDVMVVALRSSDGDRGYLEVCDRRKRWGRFNNVDLPALQALAGHLAAALDNQRLVMRLRHEAYHDTVTNLLNRAGLERHAAERAADGGYGGVLLLELDVLSDVTSALGHDHGESLLQIVSERLAEAAGQDRPLSRLDADRFALLLERQSEEDALALAKVILRAAGEAVMVAGMEVEPGVAAGLALCDPSDAAPTMPSMLLQQAQLALGSARAKEEPLAVYRSAMTEVYQRRFQLVSQFRHAVDSGRVILHYQPKVSLANRELIGVEALVRWMHHEYGFVSPVELIDAIEHTSSIDILFAHVLDQALEQIVNWLSRGMRIAVAVNLSVRNLLAPDFAETVINALKRHDVPAELLTLEITESTVMGQSGRSLPILEQLHDLGIRLSVDDFGTGYSSLAYLRRLPIDEIKIDRSFIQGMVTDLGDLAIVRAIIDLGRSLGLWVVAEGVEEEAGRDALRSMRCDAMQGFLLARPLPVERFENWLTSRTEPSDIAAGAKPALLRLRA